MENEEFEIGDYDVDDEGTWFTHPRKGNRIYLGPPLYVTAIATNDMQMPIGKVVRFVDRAGKDRIVILRSAIISSSGSVTGLIQALEIDANYKIATGQAKRIKDYIHDVEPDIHVVSADTHGWLPLSVTYATPYKIYGPTPVIWSGTAPYAKQPPVMGDFRATVDPYLTGNPILIFCWAIPFAAVLLSRLGLQGGGFYLRGTDSSGKSTSQYVAVAVVGPRSTNLHGLKGTGAGVEKKAMDHRDSLFALEEFGELKAADADNVVYMLGNGYGGNRYNEKTRLFKVLGLISGEVPLAEILASAGKVAKGGMELRCLQIECDKETGTEAIKKFHAPRFNSSGEFAKYLDRTTSVNYAGPMDGFLDAYVLQPSKCDAMAARTMNEYAQHVRPGNPSNSVTRAIDSFALVAAAGELVIYLNQTSLQKGEAFEAAVHCFRSWMNHFETYDVGARAIKLIRDFLLANLGAFQEVVRQKSVGKQVVGPFGYKMNGIFLIDRTIARNLCGADMDVIATILKAKGYLRFTEGRLQLVERIDGVQSRFFAVHESILAA